MTAAFLALMLWMAASPAMADWDKARTALQAGKTSEAFRILKPMAEEGDREAQYMIAYLLSTGSGAKLDLEEAYKWYTIAVARGHTAANTARSYVRRKLDFAAAAEAERKARAWLRENQRREAEDAVEKRHQDAVDKRAAKEAAEAEESGGEPATEGAEDGADKATKQ